LQVHTHFFRFLGRSPTQQLPAVPPDASCTLIPATCGMLVEIALTSRVDTMESEDELDRLTAALAEALLSGTVHGITCDRLRTWLPSADDLR